MIKKILQAVGFGLFCAFLILFVAPIINKSGRTFNLFSPDVVSYHSAVKQASPAVVNIYTQILDNTSSSGYRLNLGSGVIMSDKGYILTNKHVIKDAYQVTVYLQSGANFNASLVGSDTLTDLAVLKIAGDKLPTIPQNKDRKVQVGDVVLAIGNPYNLGQSVTQGIISATGRNTLSDRNRQNFIQTDAPISKGNSGGALINTAGELIGINTISLKNSGEVKELSITGEDTIAEGLNFAIPISQAVDVMNKIIKDGRVIRGYFGVTSALFLASQGERGVLITGVAENGPAAQAGIRPNDIVLKIGKVEAVSPSQMMEVLANMKPNTTVKVLVWRQGQELEFNVTIGEFPEP
ncbi:outer membrane-stress sensor serine endopeptidase DegS [Haemophilus paracuniculus]|uniref:Outer membrane-stress sensor serine endopeptidase DegS n=1 Tax=Haemophilus paracuniculus TaxID=734 RepID=A0A1T0AUX0_9PAST|nr:trypsin-like peptidase domain-containing protein [Haemophilus paracuniculus]OOS00602.1 outer membrane-stress sensor serine endopeptidase DegS [Haemophilus paracuniculus]